MRNHTNNIPDEKMKNNKVQYLTSTYKTIDIHEKTEKQTNINLPRFAFFFFPSRALRDVCEKRKLYKQEIEIKISDVPGVGLLQR